MGTALVVTFTRISFGEIGLLTSRYKIYAILLLITLYTFIISKIELTRIKWLAFPLIVMTMVFNLVANYLNFKEIVNFRNQLISFSINWKLNPEIQTPKPSITLYEAPSLALNKGISALKKPIKLSPLFSGGYRKYGREQSVLIQNSSVINRYGLNNGSYLVAQSPQKNYLIPTLLINYSPYACLRTGQYWQKGFEGELNYNEFENGTYQLGILVNNGQKMATYYLNDSLIVNNTKPRNVKTNW